MNATKHTIYLIETILRFPICIVSPAHLLPEPGAHDLVGVGRDGGAHLGEGRRREQVGRRQGVRGREPPLCSRLVLVPAQASARGGVFSSASGFSQFSTNVSGIRPAYT